VLLKVFFAGAVPAEVTARNLAGVAAALASQRAQLEAIAARLDAAPVHHPDEPYWRLTLDFGLAFMRTALEWLERAQRVLRAPSTRPRAKAPGRTTARPTARARAPRRPEAR
jgi:hypothetical protein